jgi:hypothetical protein
MTADKTVVSIVLTLLLVMAIPATLLLLKLPDSELTPSEKELISFSNPSVAITTPSPLRTFTGRTCPVTKPAKANRDSADKSLKGPSYIKSTPPRSLASLPVVSMIYYAGSTRMAIVDGHVVNEGSDLDGGVIIKIDKNQVLMRKAGKDLWLTTE